MSSDLMILKVLKNIEIKKVNFKYVKPRFLHQDINVSIYIYTCMPRMHIYNLYIHVYYIM